MNIFKMQRAGPLSTWAPGPARRILNMFIKQKTIEGGDLLIGVNLSRGLLVYIDPVNLFTYAWSTCLHKPNQLVYISLVNLFT